VTTILDLESDEEQRYTPSHMELAKASIVVTVFYLFASPLSAIFGSAVYNLKFKNVRKVI
jgi:hypothetical protein